MAPSVPADVGKSPRTNACAQPAPAGTAVSRRAGALETQRTPRCRAVRGRSRPTSSCGLGSARRTRLCLLLVAFVLLLVPHCVGLPAVAELSRPTGNLMYAFLCTHPDPHARTHARARTHTHNAISTHAHTHTHTHTHACMQLARTHTHIHAHTCTHTHKHTHTHTHTGPQRRRGAHRMRVTSR